MRGPGTALVMESVRPSATALIALAVVGLLLALGRTLSTAAVAPDPVGALWLGVGLLPVVSTIALPVALLFGLVTAARAWREGGDWLALAASGHGCRAVLPAVLLWGVLLGGAGLTLSHGLEPAGRRLIRSTLSRTAGDLRLQPDRPLVVGDSMIVALGVDGGLLRNVLIASGDTAIAAQQGRLGGGGSVMLQHGRAVSLASGGSADWQLSFEQATLRLDLEPQRVELSERTDAQLRQIILRLRGHGGSAAVQRLMLAKRWFLPACLPMLAVLAVPLGARGARPAAVATVTVLLWWAVLRLADQAVQTVGPQAAALAPLVALTLACGLAWLSWRDR